VRVPGIIRSSAAGDIHVDIPFDGSPAWSAVFLELD
jgi:hypothetical protein